VYEQELFPSRYGLETIGFLHRGQEYWNLSPAALVEEAVRRREGRLTNSGALVTRTGPRTGRSPKDKFIVREPSSDPHIAWGNVNVAMEDERFEKLRQRIFGYLGQRDIFVQDLYAGAHPAQRYNVRVVTELAWHSLFARQLLIRPSIGATTEHSPDVTIVCAAGCKAELGGDGVNSDAFIVLDLSRQLVLIGGTAYAGEIKKSVFTLLNYYLPLSGVLPMHCAANLGEREDVALFFGLSGTGKTTLSADPTRRLIGDDEHGWGRDGVFNFEGGCYAKVIGLSTQDEPQIYRAIRFGTVLENVVVAPYTHTCCFDDASITENTRAGYPLDYIENSCEPALGGHPSNIVFLTCDAFGVLPPISRLTPAQAMYHFLSGYTAKVGGTEAGLGSEPQATFSACFGEPFLPLRPAVYAELLGRKIDQHGTRVWMVNTGWSGGPYGVGSRIKLRFTRAMVHAALNGLLDDVTFQPHAIFQLAVPQNCPNVPPEILDPQKTWRKPDDYERQAFELAGRFERNFTRFPDASAEIQAAGPLTAPPKVARSA